MSESIEHAREGIERARKAREHGFSGAPGALQIAILIASMSIVTAVRGLRWGATAIGFAAITFGLMVGWRRMTRFGRRGC